MSFRNKSLLISLCVLACSHTSVLAGVNGVPTIPQSVPAISQAGLIGLALVIGLLGAKIINKFKK